MKSICCSTFFFYCSLHINNTGMWTTWEKNSWKKLIWHQNIWIVDLIKKQESVNLVNIHVDSEMYKTWFKNVHCAVSNRKETLLFCTQICTKGDMGLNLSSIRCQTHTHTWVNGVQSIQTVNSRQMNKQRCIFIDGINRIMLFYCFNYIDMNIIVHITICTCVALALLYTGNISN